METHFYDRLRPIAIVRSYGNQSSAICVCSNRLTWLALNKVKLVTRNLWRKLRDVSAFTSVTVKISKTKTKRLTAGKKVGEKFNLSPAEVEVKFRKTGKCYLLDRGEMQFQENFKIWNGLIHILHTDNQEQI